MIRSYFQKKPETLPIDLWAKLYQEAIYLKTLDAKTQAEILSKIFGGTPSE